MVRAALPLLLLMTALLAGCSSPEPGDTSGGQDAASAGLPATELPWGLTQCRFGVILVPVAASVVQPHVPEGFRVQSPAEVGIEGQAPLDVPNPLADGNFGLEAFECDEGVGLDGRPVPGMSYASYFTGVEPPAELRQEVSNHFVKWDVLVPDDDRRALLSQYGIPAHAGTASVTMTAAEGPLAVYSATVASETMGSFTMQGTALAALPAGSFAEFTATPGGLAVWTTEYSLTAGGAGPQAVTVPAGSWAADIVGAGEHQGAGFAGIGTFSPGRLALPAQPGRAA